MKIVVGNSYCKVESKDSKVHKGLYDLLSYQDKDILLIKHRDKKYYLDATKSFYNRKSHSFLTGLLDNVLDYCKLNNIECQIIDTRKNEDLPILEHDIIGIDYYDYQEEAIQIFCKKKRGVLKLATSAGKTIIAKGIFKALNIPTLFLTHRVQLLHQSAKRFSNRLPEYRDKIGMIGDGNFYPNFLTFATSQTLYSMLKKDENDIRRILSAYKMVIVDEAHRMGSDSFSSSVSACTNAEYRLGLTATPFMRNDPHEDMSLIGGIGDVIYEVGVKELADAGVIARPFVKYSKIDMPQNIMHLKYYPEIYKRGIIDNKYRNDIIVKTTKEAMKIKPHILTIITNIRHGEILLDLYKKAGINASFCSGKVDASERDYNLKLLENGDIDVLIATNIMDEGISVNGIGSVILAGGGKSAPAVYQRSGRAMRLDGSDKPYMMVYDFYDTTNKILARHSKIRYNIFKNDPAFHILNKEKK